MMMNRIGIPDSLKSTNDREVLSTKTVYEENKGKLSITSHVVKTKSKGRKNIILLATQPPLRGVTKDDNCEKTAIIKWYDFTKIGTDAVDQRNAKYTTKTMSKRWSQVGFAYNAMVIWAVANGKSPKKVDTFYFTMAFGDALLKLPLQKHATQTPNIEWMQ